MAVFRSLHVTPNTIAMVPIHGYVNDIRYSPDSIRWLDFVSHNENIVVLHALNGTGEKKIHGISVDGDVSITVQSVTIQLVYTL
ncbi:uncharacterized protein CEXT_220921 [Caerostris extrusa]|uniref:Uncharacterized protein n=1 Tax=Caerostris extrusa TaxID=172846 RepID=A0AAV4VF94_CAEEX|nr:uncharacterized protein CEXT_220921 [Caerostris extrusa]